MIELKKLINNKVNYSKRITPDNNSETLKAQKYLGKISTAIAHEVRNPLQTAIAFIQTMEKLNIDGKVDKLEKYYKLVTSELKRADSLLDEFMLLSKNRVNLKFEVYDINKICRESVLLLKSVAYLKGQVIKESYAYSSSLIYIDSDKMRQVIFNLVINAIEASEENSIIFISTKDFADYIEINVCDKGCGMSEEEKNKVFDFFYTTKENGTGIGMPLCLDIVEAHGGNIDIYSKKGVGTEIIICLPKK